MKNLSEAELVVLAQSGNNKAITKLLKEMRVKMMKSMRYHFKTMSTEDLEDAVQTSLMKAYSKLDTYNPTYSFNSWLTRICKNTVIDGKRKKAKQGLSVSLDETFDGKEGEGTTMGNLLPSSGMNPLESMVNNEKGDFVMELLSSKELTESTLNIAQMRFLDQLSYDEISEEMDCPLGTVKARLHRFKKFVEENVANTELATFE
jgi:RNA polymerase sigma-70 factor (ECF subfamily)